MQQLSFTIPYTSSAIRGVITALNQMDNDLNSAVGLFSQAVATAHSKHEAFVEKTMSTITETPEFRDVPNCPTPPPPPVEEEVDNELAQPEGAVDSAGTPWDERIHSGAKTFLQSDGTWKLKRGVDKALVAQVTAELMGNVSTGTSVTPSNVSTPTLPVEVITESVPPPPPVDETPVLPDVTAFRKLLSEITKAGLAPDYVQTICREVNGCTLPECKDDMDKLSMLRMSLGL